ncbi:hypothetical protein ACHAWC_007536 [Mediolabrus comicus]
MERHLNLSYLLTSTRASDLQYVNFVYQKTTTSTLLRIVIHANVVIIMSTTNPRNGGTNDDDTQHGGYWYAESQGRSHAYFDASYAMSNLWRNNRNDNAVPVYPQSIQPVIVGESMWESPIVHYDPMMIQFQRQQHTIQYYAPPVEYIPVSLSGEDYYCHQSLNPVPAAPSLSSTSSSFEKNEAPSFEPSNNGHEAPTKPKRQLFVFHIPEDMTDADLNELFSSCGEVSKSCIERDENGATRGYGFVTFRYANCAAEAIKQLNGYHVGKKYLSVMYCRDKTRPRPRRLITQDGQITSRQARGKRRT